MTEKLVFSTCLFISRESRLESGVEPGSGIRSSYSVDGLVSYIRPVTLYLCLRNLVLCCVLCTGAYTAEGVIWAESWRLCDFQKGVEPLSV